MLSKYPLILRFLHWLTGILIISLIALGYYMVGLNPDHSPDKWDLYATHKSIGMVVLLLVIARIVIRKFSKIPEVFGKNKKVRMVVDLIHKFLYLLMLMIPLSGYLMSSFGGYGVMVFGFKLPNLLEKNEYFRNFAYQIHGILPYVILMLVVIHVAGTLKHIIFDKENILKKII